MTLVVGSVVMTVLVVVGAGFALWMLVPTLRLLGRPDFEPTPKDDASVENALMMRLVDAGQ
jgi:hypothetical protein